MSDLNSGYRTEDQPGGGFTQYEPTNLAPNNAYALLSLPFAFIFPIVGLIFGIVGRKQINQSGERGSGIALAGIILSALQIVLFVVYILVVGSVLLPALLELRNMAETSPAGVSY